MDAAGVISTVAGDGTPGDSGDGGPAVQARLNFPRGVAVDGAGNLYIADRGNESIRKIDAAGIITTVVGIVTPGYGGDGGPAVQAQLNVPKDVTVDEAGNLYIADTNNNRIRKVDTAGNISTVAGGGSSFGDGGAAVRAQLLLPESVAVDGAGNIYIADTSNHRIRKVNTAGNISTFAGGAVGDGGAAVQARLNHPTGVAVDGAGNLYIADTSNHRIRKVDTAGVMATVAGNGTPGDGGDGGAAAQAQLNNPTDVAVDGAGNLYIADWRNNRIRKVDAAGNIATVAGGGSSFGDGGAAVRAQLDGPSGVAVDGAGNLYIADWWNNRIRKVDAAGNISTVAGGGSSFGDGGAAVRARLDGPSGVAVDGAGSLYIADASNDRIRKVDTAGVITTVAGVGMHGFGGDNGAAVQAWLNNPTDVAVDGSGNLYIADLFNQRIRKVDAAGVITTVAGTAERGFGGDGGAAVQARLNDPSGVAVDEAGNLYIADEDNHRIRKVSPRAVETPQPPEERQPGTVRARSLELSFVLPQDAEPAAQPLVLYANNGAANFQARPGTVWIAVSPESGNLAENEETTVTVTVNPYGLREGPHRGMLYIYSDGSITDRLAVALEVLPSMGLSVSENGVVNAAAMSAFGEPGLFGPTLLPVAPGSIIAVFGRNFTGGGESRAEGAPLPGRLGGVRLTVGGMEAPLFWVGPNQINAQLPAALGEDGARFSSVIVENAEKSSFPRIVPLAAAAPGIFTVTGTGTGQGVVVFSNTAVLAAPLGSIGGAESRPARAGDIVSIYATGLGAVEPPLADGKNSCEPDGRCLADGSNVVLRHTVEQPEVWIGGVSVAGDKVLYSGLAPEYPGLNVAVVEMPAGIVPSDAAEVVIAIGGKASQAGVTIAVE